MEHFLCENFSDKWVTYRCGGAMGWCTAVVWCDAVVRCGGVVRYGDAVVRWRGAVAWSGGAIRWCDVVMQRCGDALMRRYGDLRRHHPGTRTTSATSTIQAPGPPSHQLRPATSHPATSTIRRPEPSILQVRPITSTIQPPGLPQPLAPSGTRTTSVSSH